MRAALLVTVFALAGSTPFAQETLPNTTPLTMEGDLAAQMVAGINRYLDQAIADSVDKRARHWNRDTSSPEAYSASIAENRERFRRYIGAVDERVALEMEFEPGDSSWNPAERSQPPFLRRTVRWRVFNGVNADGVYVEPYPPLDTPNALVVLLPDCDSNPRSIYEDSAAPRDVWAAASLARAGANVVIPTLLSRSDTFSGNPEIRMTNQPHREYIYRAAFELGRHIIGYEASVVQSLIDYFDAKYPEVPITVAGYGEGGLIAMYTAAIDERVDTVFVSGYFGPRELVWSEPIYRNVWGLLDEFGDAEIASLIAPRTLIIESSAPPVVAGPPKSRDGRSGAAPGKITVPAPEEIDDEATRAQRLTEGLREDWIQVIHSAAPAPYQANAIEAIARSVNLEVVATSWEREARGRNKDSRDLRMQRRVSELVQHNMRLMRASRNERDAFWANADAADVASWEESTEAYREYLWDEVIGRFPEAMDDPNVQSRRVYDEESYTGYEMLIPIWPEVYAYGILLLPKDIQDGERRPVVVCQHGLEGRPQDVADPGVDHRAYHQYGCKLAEKGYVVFAPQNPYIGGDDFRVIQRKANPLKKSLFGIIVRQHEAICHWLADQPFVDKERIAFYGLSYGGKTAMRVPAILDEYCLSICSADYNEWIWKNCSYEDKYSYIFTGEYEMYEWNLANTFNYAELSWLICPRPFMVERGHHDGVAPDEWVGYEYARTQRRYNLLGIGDRTEIEWFDGPHMIHGVGTFEFLDNWLK